MPQCGSSAALVTGNAQRAESDKRRDDGVISTGPARRLLLRHGADPIAGRVPVNHSGGSAFQRVSFCAK